ncbi:hypothetical protein M8J75_004871 [Diaphorina citri]|nr:hypothetical protein M8J75_004871 [Diaphorina citri]
MQMSQHKPADAGSYIEKEDLVYLLSNIPVSLHEVCGNKAEPMKKQVLMLDESYLYVRFEPKYLDFNERYLGIPYQMKVTIVNVHQNRTLHLQSISGSTLDFCSSFFEDKIIPPSENTTFNVVLLGREEGEIETNLYIHTSEGIFKFKVRGMIVENPYRVRPVLSRLPLNASFSPTISIHNPYSSPLQLVEVYKSDGEMSLELPGGGDLPAPRSSWEIAPFSSKPILRVRYNAVETKNHTSYIRLKVNNSDEVLVVPIGIEVSPQPGLYPEEDIIDLGVGGSLDPNTKVKLYLKNSNKKAIKILGIVPVPTTEVLTVDFDPIKVPPDTAEPFHVATLTYNWAAAHRLRKCCGTILVRTQGQGRLMIPFTAKVLEGGLGYDESVTKFKTTEGAQKTRFSPRGFMVSNRFRFPLVITSVTLHPDAAQYFEISNFQPVVMQPKENQTLFTLQFKQSVVLPRNNFPTSLSVQTNVSTVMIRLFCYSGRLTKITQNGDPIDLGLIGSDTRKDTYIAFMNENPVPIFLTTWGTNLTNIALEFLGTERGNASSFLSKFHTFYNLTKSMSVLPGHYAVLRVSVFTTHLSDTTQFNTGSRGAWEGVQYGSVWLKTDYERATLSLRMNLARGGLDILPDPVYIRHCFPGKVCRETLRVASRFNIPMSVLSVSPVLHNPHFAFVKEEGATISPGSSSAIGEKGGIKWIDTLSLPSNTRDFDMENLKLQNVDFKHLLLKKINLTLKLETNAVSGFLFRTSVAMTRASVTRERVVHFPLTQIGNTSYRNITLVNPFERHTLKVQLVLEKHYPYSNTIISEIPDSLKPSCNFGDCHFTSPQEFGFEKIHQDSHVLSSPIHSVHKDTPFYELEPGENITVNLAFAPSLSQKSTALLFIRNDKTVLETVLLSGIGALVQFDFANRKPGCSWLLTYILCLIYRNDKTVLETVLLSGIGALVQFDFANRKPGCSWLLTYILCLIYRNDKTVLETVLLSGIGALVQFDFANRKPGCSWLLTYILCLIYRNDKTVLETVLLSGIGALVQFDFANRKPGSSTPITFSYERKHVDECENYRSILESKASSSKSFKRRKSPLEHLTIMRSFSARNTGELPIDVFGFTINGLKCQGYGFKVLNCRNFTLTPNSSRKIDISFTPDLSLTKVSRVLTIDTSMAPRASATYTLEVALSLELLETCSALVSRPRYERHAFWTLFVALSVVFVAVVTSAYLDARHLCDASLVYMLQQDETGVQPVLDLRKISSGVGLKAPSSPPLSGSGSEQTGTKVPPVPSSSPGSGCLSWSRFRRVAAGMTSGYFSTSASSGSSGTAKSSPCVSIGGGASVVTNGNGPLLRKRHVVTNSKRGSGGHPEEGEEGRKETGGSAWTTLLTKSHNKSHPSPSPSPPAPSSTSPSPLPSSTSNLNNSTPSSGSVKKQPAPQAKQNNIAAINNHKLLNYIKKTSENANSRQRNLADFVSNPAKSNNKKFRVSSAGGKKEVEEHRRNVSDTSSIDVKTTPLDELMQDSFSSDDGKSSPNSIDNQKDKENTPSSDNSSNDSPHILDPSPPLIKSNTETTTKTKNSSKKQLKTITNDVFTNNNIFDSKLLNKAPTNKKSGSKETKLKKSSNEQKVPLMKCKSSPVAMVTEDKQNNLDKSSAILNNATPSPLMEEKMSNLNNNNNNAHNNLSSLPSLFDHLPLYSSSLLDGTLSVRNFMMESTPARLNDSFYELSDSSVGSPPSHPAPFPLGPIGPKKPPRPSPDQDWSHWVQRGSGNSEVHGSTTGASDAWMQRSNGANEVHGSGTGSASDAWMQRGTEVNNSTTSSAGDAWMQRGSEVNNSTTGSASEAWMQRGNGATEVHGSGTSSAGDAWMQRGNGANEVHGSGTGSASEARYRSGGVFAAGSSVTGGQQENSQKNNYDSTKSLSSSAGWNNNNLGGGGLLQDNSGTGFLQQHNVTQFSSQSTYDDAWSQVPNLWDPFFSSGGPPVSTSSLGPPAPSDMWAPPADVWTPPPALWTTPPPTSTGTTAGPPPGFAHLGNIVDTSSPPPPLPNVATSQPYTVQGDTMQGSGQDYDPFRSLSHIWNPHSGDIWKHFPSNNNE